MKIALVSLIAQSETFQQASQWPWVLLALLTVPLLLVIWRFRTYPTWVWLVPLGLALLFSGLSLVSPIWLTLVMVVDWALLTLVILDLIVFLTSTRVGISGDRSVAQTASLGVDLASEVTVENRTRITLRGRVRDDLPEHFEGSPAEHRLLLPPGGRVTMRRRLTPRRRGAFALEHLYLRLKSPLRFWSRMITLHVLSSLNVYPDKKQLSNYAILARTNRLSLIGVRRTRRIGQDSDFERLRDYTRDDNYRHIDWRSTARRSKLTVKQFQSDQSQRVVFLLDCGRMMTNQRAGYSLLDHALNAALMMAYVALHQGDEVGMLCFSDQVDTYVPPRGGGSQMNRLIQAGFDQFPRLVESRYDQAFMYLANHCKRRSLVVLATSIIDEVNANQVVDHLAKLTARHLPMILLLRDRQVFDAADHPEGSTLNLYRSAAAADLLLWRHQVMTDLQHKGVLVVDEFPDELTAPLINQYLRIKAKHLL